MGWNICALKNNQLIIDNVKAVNVSSISTESAFYGLKITFNVGFDCQIEGIDTLIIDHENDRWKIVISELFDIKREKSLSFKVKGNFTCAPLVCDDHRTL